MSSTLMVSVSGMRGHVGRDLTPDLVARYAGALGTWAAEGGRPLVVLGRDSRTSGAMFAHAATAGLLGAGCDVVDLGIVATPTTQLAVEHHGAGAGLMLSASHNPVEWNALKFIGPDGIFLGDAAGARVRAIAEAGPAWRGWDGMGRLHLDPDAIGRHLDLVLALPWLDVPRIRARGFHLALDCVHGAGGAIVPTLLERLGCRVSGIGLETDGRFPREPEPLPQHLVPLGALVREVGADLGMAVDPDVDRLALVDEQGRPIGEDYTLAFAVRAVLARSDGPGVGRSVVANLSTSRVVEDAAVSLGARFVRAPVGEAHVARAIQEEQALIGGEGNGGVILPSLHIGRDAPVGAALVLQYLVDAQVNVGEAVKLAPAYRIVKAKVPVGGDVDRAYVGLAEQFPGAEADRRDGLRLAWPDRWLHVRPSGTEPIVRLIAEAPTEAQAEDLVEAGRRLLA